MPNVVLLVQTTSDNRYTICGKKEDMPNKKWEKAEIKDTKLFGTRKQRGSGNQPHYPTDSFSDRLAIETKYTDKQSYSISLVKWHKLTEETATLNQKDNKLRVPVFSIHLGDTHLVVLAYEDLEYLVS
jgi:hypothetical protein